MTDNLPTPITTLTRSQRTQILNLVRRAARSEILPRFRSLGADQIATKADAQDLVTEADTAAEAMIARGLARLFPSALIVGEEACAKQPDLAKDIDQAPLAFTIDPVDGTWNYASGLSVFGVMVAMTCYGRPVFGLLYDPLNDDVVWAASGEPTLVQRHGRVPSAASVSPGGKVADLVGAIPLYMIPPDGRDAVAAAMPRFQRAMSLRCSCHEYRTLAQGHIDFVLSVGLTPWDHPAGVLCVAQAGGHVAMLDGSDYTAGTNTGYLLAASNAETWGRVRDALSVLLEVPNPPVTA